MSGASNGFNLPKFSTDPIPKNKGIRLLSDEDPQIPRSPSHIPQSSQSKSGITDRLESIAENSQAGQQRLQTFKTVKQALEVEGIHLPAPGRVPLRSLGGRLNAFVKRRLSLAVEPEIDKEKELFLKELRKQKGERDQDSLIHLETFKKVLNVKDGKFAAHLFSALDADDRGYLTDDQLVSTLLDLKRGTPAVKIAFIWSFVTTNAKEINRAELAELIKAGWSEKAIELDPMAVDGLTEAFFKRAGRANKDTMTLQDFTRVLESRPELRESLLLGDLMPAMEKEEKEKAFSFLPLWERMTALDDFTFPFWMTLITLAQLAAFAAGMVQWSRTGPNGTPAFRYDGWTYPIAKGAGRALQVTVILFPFTVARGFLTFLRRTPLANILPLDGHIEFHKYLAYQFAFWGVLHTVCHIINGVRQSEPSRWKTAPGGVFGGVSQAVYYSYEVQVTGVLLCFFLLVGYIPALLKGWAARLKPEVVKSQRKRFPLLSKLWLSFEFFYVTHIVMACTVLILLIIHPYPGNLKDFGTGPNVNYPDSGTPQEGSTWIYLAAGVLVYLLERVARWFKAVLWSTDVLEAVLLPGGVTELKLRKPGRLYNSYQPFRGKPGQYCFIKIPALAAFEWHPFSLTSASHDDFISFHVQAVGDWTIGLQEMCEDLYKAQPEHDVETPTEQHESKSRKLIKPPFEVLVDGPCGAPAQDYSGFEVVLLVGLGIGVTPFAAVLRQLVEDYKKSRCKRCGLCNDTLFMTRRVYFYWVTPEREAPKYFQHFLQEIVNVMPDFLEVNIHFTKGGAENDVRITVGRIAQLIQHEDEHFDAVAGTYQPRPVYFGRPKWPKVFEKVRKEQPGSKVGVFVCGKRNFSSEVKGICIQQNKLGLLEDRSAATQFFFHKENF